MSHQSPDVGDPQDDGMSPEEKAAIVEALIEEMRTLFHDYITGEVAYDELSFEMFDTLQTVHAVANDSLIVEYDMEEFDINDMVEIGDDVVVEPPTAAKRQKGRGKHGH
ncbi:MAG: hypothetical protein M9890_15320 [Thermomicrobiales bacterium]|nr:hypothetical protein [Thermomicrobiales bacterium]